MSVNKEDTLNLLQFPDEVIAHIFSFVPDHASIREVCTRFNDLSCQMKSFKIHFKVDWDESYTRLVEDDEIFDSMLKSQRKITSIEISNDLSGGNELIGEKKDRWLKMMEYFSPNVKLIEFNGDVLSEEFLESINLLENLEKISMRNVKRMKKEVASEIFLNLNNLREIESFNCCENVLKEFGNLPQGVLRRLSIVFKAGSAEIDENLKLFRNQENLKEIVTSTNFLKFLNLSKLKLNFLTLKGPKTVLDGVINGQDQLTKFVIGEVAKNELTLICHELKSLKELEISALECQRTEFYQLSKLKNLKKLKIMLINLENYAFNETLTFFENKNLSFLDMNSYHNEIFPPTMESLGLNCPNLRKMKITSRSQLHIMNPIINFFPKLTELELEGLTEKKETPYEFKGEIIHNNLRKLVLSGLKTESSDFAKLINTFKNLEELQTTMAVSADLLREILTTQTLLKLLILNPSWGTITDDHKMTREFIEILKHHGKELKTFKGIFFNKEKVMDYQKVAEEFKEIYSEVMFIEPLNVVECEMKK